MMYTFRLVLMALFATLFLVAASCDDQVVGDEEPTDGSVGEIGEIVEGDAANDAVSGDAATDTESTDGSVDSNVSDAEVSTGDAEGGDVEAGDAEATSDGEPTADGGSSLDAETVDAVMPEDDAAVTVDAEETEEDQN